MLCVGSVLQGYRWSPYKQIWKQLSCNTRGLRSRVYSVRYSRLNTAAATAHLPEFDDQNAPARGSVKDEAFIASVIGDTADRGPAKLSARAQQQIQRLRSLRSTAGTSGSLPAQGDGNTPTSGFGRHNAQERVQQQFAADQNRLPSKAELRGTVGTVSRKVYEQVIQSRNRLSVRLSAAKKQNKQLQRTSNTHIEEVAAVHDCLTTVMAEVNAVTRLAQTAAASAQFGANKQDTVAKMGSLLDRMQVLQQVLQDHTSQVDKLRHRQIPIVWYGIAQQVRLMGDFDGWTQGFSLSADEIHDGTFTKFQATLSLPPGLYQVKFVVDDQWQTAPGWPTVETQQGSNNLLQV